MNSGILDTHIHIWDLNRVEYLWLKDNKTILNRNYTLEVLDKERIDTDVKAGILVQAANNFEDTELMLEAALQSEWIKGVVGWLPLMNPGETESKLKNKYGHHKYFKGVRHLIHDEKDPRWLLQDKVIESLKIIDSIALPYDVVGILPEHLESAIKIAEKLPGLKLVLDHMNQPPIKTGERFGRWGELMKAASGHKNIFVKISGLGTTSGKNDWTAADIKPYIEFVLTHYGKDRCMCGGDWPVSLLAGSYKKTWNNYKEAIDGLLNKEDAEKVYYGNGLRIYNL